MEAGLTYLYLDLETFSGIPIEKGAHKYAENAEILLTAWAIDDDPVQVAEGWPQALSSVISNTETTIVMHNGGGFDRTVLRHALGIDLPLDRIWDTMVQALMHSLPGSLDSLCAIMGVPLDLAKQQGGRELIQLFCKPRPKNMKLRRATKATHPKEWAAFCDYAKHDISAMRVVKRKMPTWNMTDYEQMLWRYDQMMNDRGFAVDVELAEAALRTVSDEQNRLSERTQEHTDGEVQSTRQRDALLAHLLKEYDLDLPDVRKSTVEKMLQDESLPEGVRLLLSIRQQASTSSTAKYKTLLGSVSKDGRLRGTIQFCGASRTGRDAGRIFQPQNISRGKTKADMVERYITAMKADCLDLVADNVMQAASDCLRGSIIARPGHKLVVADLSNIEGRVAAWIAGEEWKLQAFRDYDTIVDLDAKGEPIRKGHDLYVLAFARSFGVEPEDVSKADRQVGKVQELALQYAGGVGAFVTFAAVYGIDLDKLADGAINRIPKDVLEEAERYYEWARKKGMSDYGLSRRTFVVCDSLKRLWRRAHPAIVNYWSEIDDALAAANRGEQIGVGRCVFDRYKAWLRIRGPSGRYLSYPAFRYEKGKACYEGVNQLNRKWGKQFTYNGKVFENMVQHTARDVLFANIPQAEEQGYPVLLRVHDELIAETVDTPDFTSDNLALIMATNPEWAKGLPLAAAGFEAKRYRKD